MNFARFILAGSALAWAGFGLLFFVSPENLDGVGLVVDNAVARAEVRAFYGGLELGIAAFLAWSVADPRRYRTGLMASGLIIGITGLGRLIGIGMEGFETATIMWAFVGIELTAAAVSFVAMARLPNQ